MLGSLTAARSTPPFDSARIEVHMKDYIYISDAKVDVLYPQITSKLGSSSSVENKIDLKFYSRSTKTDIDENRITKLETVCQFIEQYGNLGTITDPSEYIFGTISMEMLVVERADFVFWGSRSTDAVIGLGGSAKHLIGNAAPPGPYYSRSYFHHILRELRRIFTESSGISSPTEYGDDEMIYEFIRRLRGPSEQFEFLARTLRFGKGVSIEDRKLVDPTTWKGNVLLATPLYVARAFNPISEDTDAVEQIVGREPR